MRDWTALVGIALVGVLSLAVLSSGQQDKVPYEEVGKKIRAIYQEVPDDVVAIINGEYVTLQEIEVRKMVMTINRKLAGDDTPVTNKDALDALVGDKVQIAEARRRGLYPTEEEIDTEYASVREQ